MPENGYRTQMTNHPLWRTFSTWALINNIDLDKDPECKEWFACFVLGAEICEKMHSKDMLTEGGIYMPKLNERC